VSLPIDNHLVHMFDYFFYSDIGAFFSLLKCVVGTGVMAIPLSFNYAGIITGIILLVSVCFMLIHGMQMLVSLT